jgi:hypothetical protein
MMIDFTKEIKGITSWTVLGEMPTGKGPIVRALKEQYNTEGHGVYQLIEASHISKNIDNKTFVDPDIGYTGMSANIFNRAGQIKTGAHNAGKMVYQKFKSPLTEVYIRYIFCEPSKEKLIEDSIHKESLIKYKYKFKWREASGGIDGISTRIQADLDKVENPSEIINIIKKAEERWAEITLSAAKSGTASFRDLVDEYFTEDE